MNNILDRNRLVSVRGAAKIAARLHRSGGRLVFTNGCFDILHRGHVRYLQEAKLLGDVLMVGINSDRSTKLLKGPGRPLVSQFDRAAIVSALRCVDYVTIFDDTTPTRLISILKPDICVKGGDYKHKELPELDAVKAYGGRMVIAKYFKGRSTSGLIEKICALR